MVSPIPIVLIGSKGHFHFLCRCFQYNDMYIRKQLCIHPCFLETLIGASPSGAHAPGTACRSHSGYFYARCSMLFTPPSPPTHWPRARLKFAQLPILWWQWITHALGEHHQYILWRRALLSMWKVEKIIWIMFKVTKLKPFQSSRLHSPNIVWNKIPLKWPLQRSHTRHHTIMRNNQIKWREYPRIENIIGYETYNFS